ncbi:hypothetical protein YC2023_010425 [Brassica napus]
MTWSMFLDGRSEVLRILPIVLNQQPKNRNAPIGYHSTIFNPTKEYPIRQRFSLRSLSRQPEGVFYETNFTRRITHQGVIKACNFKRSFMDQKIKNFTSQRFLSTSICEYPTLEGNSSPRK